MSDGVSITKGDTMKKYTPVFIISLSLTIIFILWGAITPNNLEAVSSKLQQFLQMRFD